MHTRPIFVAVDCQWSDWSPSGSCSKSCGPGMQNFTRVKTIQESPGVSCSGSYEKTEHCYTQGCPGKLPYRFQDQFFKIGIL